MPNLHQHQCKYKEENLKLLRKESSEAICSKTLIYDKTSFSEYIKLTKPLCCLSKIAEKLSSFGNSHSNQKSHCKQLCLIMFCKIRGRWKFKKNIPGKI